MKRYTFSFTLFILSSILIIGSCTNSDEAENTDTQKAQTEEKNLIEISEQQFETGKMKLGSLSMQEFNEEVECNGYLTTPPNGTAFAGTQLPGIVKSIRSSLGKYVKKGQTLFMLSSNDFINLQQNFSESSAALKQVKADFERNKKLYNEKVISEKTFIASESAYKSVRAKYQSLKLQLRLLNLNVDKIEAGELYPAFPVTAPISGTVSAVNVSLGQYAEPQQTLAEIIDNTKLQLHLSVFENDIYKLKIGQNVQFSSSENPEKYYSAVITSVGRSINEQSKTITCIARINKTDDADFVNSSYIKARITVADKKVAALPDNAFVKSDNGYYIFKVEKNENNTYYLHKIKIKTGKSFRGYTEVLNPEEFENAEIVIDGVYNLNE